MDGDKMKILLFVLFIILPNLLYAAAKDARISDKDGDVLEVASDGTIVISTTNVPGSAQFIGALDRRICDNQGDCLVINADGSANATLGAPDN